MEKTIIINISGTIFHIEEYAYETLKTYINSLKKHFSASADSFEIITDIENRIAELLNSLLKEGKQVINSADVSFVIGQMGSPADFESTEQADEPVYESLTDEPIKKRLYRDDDSRIIGGVCSGIAAYFDIDPIGIRLAWGIAFFFMGFGFMLYIILWIIMPKAVTRAEKLAMRGEKATVSNIHRAVKAEMKGNGKEDSLSTKAGNFIKNIFELIADVGRSFVKIFVKVIAFMGMLFSFLGMIGVIVATASMFGIGSGTVSMGDLHFGGPFHLFNMQLLPNYMQPWFILACAIAGFIPLLFIFLMSLHVLSGRSFLTKVTGFAMLISWLIALGFSIYFAICFAGGFKQGGNLRIIDTLKPTANKVYYLKLNPTESLSKEDSTALRAGGFSLKGDVHIDGEHQEFNWDNMELEVERGMGNTVELEKVFSARGKDLVDAVKNAEQMQYQFKQQDSIIYFDGMFKVPQGTYFRGQNLQLTLRLPEGSKVVIDEEIRCILGDIWGYDCFDDYEHDVVLYVGASGVHCKERKEGE